MLTLRKQEMNLLLEQLQTTESVSTEHDLILSSVARQSDRFVLGGSGPGFWDVYNYTAALLHSGQFSDVHVVRIQALNKSIDGEGRSKVSLRVEALLTPDPGPGVAGGTRDVSQ
jgi:hypothetical protein